MMLSPGMLARVDSKWNVFLYGFEPDSQVSGQVEAGSIVLVLGIKLRDRERGCYVLVLAANRMGYVYDVNLEVIQ